MWISSAKWKLLFNHQHIIVKNKKCICNTGMIHHLLPFWAPVPLPSAALSSCYFSIASACPWLPELITPTNLNRFSNEAGREGGSSPLVGSTAASVGVAWPWADRWHPALDPDIWRWLGSNDEHAQEASEGLARCLGRGWRTGGGMTSTGEQLEREENSRVGGSSGGNGVEEGWVFFVGANQNIL
jgi:hypothetical protein